MSSNLPSRRSISPLWYLFLTALCAVSLASAAPARADLQEKWKNEVLGRLDNARAQVESGKAAEAVKTYKQAAEAAIECTTEQKERSDWTLGGSLGGNGKGVYCPNFITAYAFYEAAHYSTGADKIASLNRCKSYLPKTEQDLKPLNQAYSSVFYRKMMLVCQLELLRGNLVDIGLASQIKISTHEQAQTDSIVLFKSLLDNVKKIQAGAQADPAKLRIATNVLDMNGASFITLAADLDQRYKALLGWPSIDNIKQGGNGDTVEIQGDLNSLLPVKVVAKVDGAVVATGTAEPGQGRFKLNLTLKKAAKVEFQIADYSAAKEVSSDDAKAIYRLVNNGEAPAGTSVATANIRVLGVPTLLASTNQLFPNRRLLSAGSFTADNLVEKDKVVVADQDGNFLTVLDAAGNPLPMVADAQTTSMVVGRVVLRANTTQVRASVQRNGTEMTTSQPVSIAFNTRLSSLAWLDTKDDRIRLAVLRVSDYTAPTGVRVNGIPYDIQPYSAKSPEADGYAERLYLLPVPRDGRNEPTVAILQGKEEQRVSFGSERLTFKAQEQEGLIKTLPEKLRELAQYAFEPTRDDERYLNAAGTALAFYQPLAEASDSEAVAIIQYEAKADFARQFNQVYLQQVNKLPDNKPAILALAEVTGKLAELAKRAGETAQLESALKNLASLADGIKVRLAVGQPLREGITPGLGLALVSMKVTGMDAQQKVTKVLVGNQPVSIASIQPIKGEVGAVQVMALIGAQSGAGQTLVQIQLSDNQTITANFDLGKALTLASGELEPKLPADPKFSNAYNQIRQIAKNPRTAPLTEAELNKMGELVRTSVHELVLAETTKSVSLANQQIALLSSKDVWGDEDQKELALRISSAEEIGKRLAVFKVQSDSEVLNDTGKFENSVKAELVRHSAIGSVVLPQENDYNHQTITITSAVTPVVKQNDVILTAQKQSANKYVFELKIQPNQKETLVTVEADLTKNGQPLALLKSNKITLRTQGFQIKVEALAFDIDKQSFERADIKNHFAICTVENAAQAEYTVLQNSSTGMITIKTKQVSVEATKATYYLPDLPEGEYVLQVTAIQGEGQTKVSPQRKRFDVVDPGGMVFIAAIDEYGPNSGIQSLPYGVQTGRDLATTLIEKYHYAAGNIYTLYGKSSGVEASDNLHLDSAKTVNLIDRDRLEEAFNNFMADVRTKNPKHIIIYLAGHGEIQDPSKGAPADYLLMASNKENLIAESLANRVALEFPNVKIVAFYDMCRNGAYTSEPNSPVASAASYVGLKSCQAKQHAYSPDSKLGLHHTFYGEALISSLAEMAGGGNLTVDHLYDLMDAKMKVLIDRAKPVMLDLANEVQSLPVKKSVFHEGANGLPSVFFRATP